MAWRHHTRHMHPWIHAGQGPCQGLHDAPPSMMCITASSFRGRCVHVVHCMQPLTCDRAQDRVQQLVLPGCVYSGSTGMQWQRHICPSHHVLPYVLVGRRVTLTRQRAKDDGHPSSTHPAPAGRPLSVRALHDHASGSQSMHACLL